MLEKFKKPKSIGMQILNQKCCLQNKPMIVTVIQDNQKTPLHINAGFLTVCKNKIQAGQSAELYRDTKFLVTFTRLSDHVKLINLQQHYGDQLFQIRTLNVCGDFFQITKHDGSVEVHGLENIAKGIILKEFYIPSISLGPLDPIPSIKRAAHALAVIKQMNLCITSKVPRNNHLVQNLFRKGIVKKHPYSQRESKSNFSRRCDDKMFTVLDLHTARRMLWFNNNAVSKFRSLFCRLPMDFARNVCLNVAIGHAGSHPSSSIFLAHTFQHVPASPDLIKSMQEVSSEEKVTVVNYLDSKGTKLKARLLKIPIACQHLLRENGIHIRSGDGYVTIGLDGTPIIVADLNMTLIPLYGSTDSETLSTFKGDLQTCKAIDNDLQRRLLLYSIGASFPKLQPAMPVLIRAATLHKHAFPDLCSPALDTWACKRIIVNR